LVVVGLLGAAGLSFWLANQFSRRGTATKFYSESWSWFLASLMLLGFAVCKQLELHLELLGFLKGEAKNGGWYDYRYQLAGGLGSLGILAGFFFLWKARRHVLRWFASFAEMLAGAAVLIMVLLLSVTSTHIIDPIFGWHFGCPGTDSYVECVAVGFILAGIFRNSRKLKIKNDFESPRFVPVSRVAEVKIHSSQAT
jgi:hypothetical protein